MRRFLIAVFVLALPLAAASTRAAQTGAAPAQPVGDPAAGKGHDTFGNPSCSNCHGITGEGRCGPPLAGRTHTYARFRAYVRNPLGRMPGYPARNSTTRKSPTWWRISTASRPLRRP